MPFFEDKQLPRSRVNVTPVDVNRANKLAHHVQNKRKLVTPANTHRWAEEFAKLRDAVDAERITATLSWYCLNIGGPYVPRAYCAKTFCAKFARIEDAMQRGVPPSAETISPEARAIVQREGLLWPEGVLAGDILELVQLTLTAYDTFYHRIARNTCPTIDNFRYYRWVFASLEPPHIYTAQWLRATHRYLWGRYNAGNPWRGTLGHLAWHVNQPRFNRWGREVCTRYTGRAGVWDELLQGMEHGKKTTGHD